MQPVKKFFSKQKWLLNVKSITYCQILAKQLILKRTKYPKDSNYCILKRVIKFIITPYIKQTNKQHQQQQQKKPWHYAATWRNEKTVDFGDRCRLKSLLCYFSSKQNLWVLTFLVCKIAVAMCNPQIGCEN